MHPEHPELGFVGAGQFGAAAARQYERHAPEHLACVVDGDRDFGIPAAITGIGDPQVVAVVSVGL
jgi:hypothetical protein